MPRYFLFILMAMVLLSPLAIDIYLPALPLIAHDFKASQSQVQSTITLFMLTMGLGQIIIGPITDRFGRRPIAIMGIILYAFSGFIAGIAASFEWLQIARISQGFAACATSIVVFSAVRDRYSVKESAQIYSYLNGFICVIPALAPGIGGMLSLQFGWRSNFFFMTAYALLILIIVGFYFAETRPENTDSAGRLYQWQRYRPILKSPHFIFYACTCMVGMTSILTYVSYSPMWLIGELGLSTFSFTLLFALNAIVNILACFSAPYLIRQFGNRTIILSAFALLILSATLQLMTYQIAHKPPMTAALDFMIPMMLLCIGFALLLGPATSIALSTFGQRAGTAAAVLGCIQMGGASILTSLIQQTSLDAPVAVAAIMGISSCALLAIMLSKRLFRWHTEPNHDKSFN